MGFFVLLWPSEATELRVAMQATVHRLAPYIKMKPRQPLEREKPKEFSTCSYQAREVCAPRRVVFTSHICVVPTLSAPTARAIASRRARHYLLLGRSESGHSEYGTMVERHHDASRHKAMRHIYEPGKLRLYLLLGLSVSKCGLMARNFTRCATVHSLVVMRVRMASPAIAGSLGCGLICNSTSSLSLLVCSGDGVAV